VGVVGRAHDRAFGAQFRLMAFARLSRHDCPSDGVWWWDADGVDPESSELRMNGARDGVDEVWMKDDYLPPAGEGTEGRTSISAGLVVHGSCK